jgi:hypothetical protein
MKDRDGLNSTISCGHGESRGLGRSLLLGESEKACAQKICSIGLRASLLRIGISDQPDLV